MAYHYINHEKFNLKPGDILAFSGKGPLSAWINLVTRGIPAYDASHCSILADWEGRLLNWESTAIHQRLGENRCEITGECIRGVQAHTLQHALHRRGKIWVYRLKRELTKEQSAELTAFLRSQIGKPYGFVGAGKTFGGICRAWIRQWLFKQNLDTVWCSEYVGAAANVFWPGLVRNPSAWAPNALLRLLVRDGVYGSRERLK